MGGATKDQWGGATKDQWGGATKDQWGGATKDQWGFKITWIIMVSVFNVTKRCYSDVSHRYV